MAGKGSKISASQKLTGFAAHWLTGARHVQSPNFDDRPQQDDISLIVVHGISLPPGEFGGPHLDELFTNKLDPNGHPYFHQIRELRVSTHFLIRRDGEVVQYVPVNKRAWHAGVSKYEGRENCNAFSIGIELEGTDHGPYEDAQYRRLAELVKILVTNYPSLSTERVVGHSDIAPGRKTDPGPHFDWQRFKNALIA